MAEHESFAGGWSIPKMVEKLWNDLYHGNGRPGFTTRIKDSEDDIETLRLEKANAADLRQLGDRVTTLERYNQTRDEKIDKRLNLLIGAVLSLAVAIIVQLIVKR